MFSHFFDKNSKWPPFLKIFSKVGVVYSSDTPTPNLKGLSKIFFELSHSDEISAAAAA